MTTPWTHQCWCQNLRFHSSVNRAAFSPHGGLTFCATLSYSRQIPFIVCSFNRQAIYTHTCITYTHDYLYISSKLHIFHYNIFVQRGPGQLHIFLRYESTPVLTESS